MEDIIHQTPEQKLAHHSERSADSLELTNKHLHNLNATTLKVATSDDIKGANLDSNERLERLEKQVTLSNKLIEGLLKQIKEQKFSLELEGLEKLVIETDKEALESNKLLLKAIEEMRKPTEINVSLDIE